MKKILFLSMLSILIGGTTVANNTIVQAEEISQQIGREITAIKLNENYATMSTFSEGYLSVVNEQGMYGYVTNQGRLAVPCIYVGGGDFSHGLAFVMNEQYKIGAINKLGEVVIPFIYDDAWGFSENISFVKKDGKVGAININGDEIIPFMYEGAGSFSEGLANVFLDGKTGYINANNEEVIPFKYDGSSAFSDGLGRVDYDGFLGFVDKNGEVVLPFEYNSDNFSEGLVACAVGNLAGFMDTNGNVVIEHQFDDARGFLDGMSAVKLNGKWGFIDKTGEIVISCNYDIVGDFSEGLAIVSKDSNWVYIDKNGNEVIDFNILTCTSFSEGLAFVNTVEGVENGEYIIGSYIFENPLETAQSITNITPEVVLPQEIIQEQTPDITETATATSTNSVININGIDTDFDAYMINENNYIKLRDLAYVLNGMGKQFEVTWDSNQKAINMLSSTPYTAVGGEMEKSNSLYETTTAMKSNAKILLNGAEIEMLAYLINDNTYFKLRDICDVLDIEITWDNVTKTIGVAV